MAYTRLLSVLCIAYAACCMCQQIDAETYSPSAIYNEARLPGGAANDDSDTNVFFQTGSGLESTGDAACPQDIAAEATEFWQKYFDEQCAVDWSDIPVVIQEEISNSAEAFKPLKSDGGNQKGCRVVSSLQDIGRLIYQAYPSEGESDENWVGDTTKAILQMEVDGSEKEPDACALFDTLKDVPKKVDLNADDVNSIVDQVKKIYARECFDGKEPQESLYLGQVLGLHPVVGKRSDGDSDGEFITLSLTLNDPAGDSRSFSITVKALDLSDEAKARARAADYEERLKDEITEFDTLANKSNSMSLSQQEDSAFYLQRRMEIRELESDEDEVQPSATEELADLAARLRADTARRPTAVTEVLGKLTILGERIHPRVCVICGKCKGDENLALLEDNDQEGKMKEQARLYPDHKPGVFLKVETAKAGSPDELKPPPIPGHVVTRGSFRVDTVDMAFGDNFHSHIMPKRTEDDHKRVWAQSRALIQTVKAELRAKNATATIPDSYHFYDSPETSGCFQPSYNQGDCGSCWAFASLGALEKQICLRAKSNVVASLSREMLVRCSEQNNACNGGNADKAYEDLMEIGGVFSTDCLPYQGKGSKHCPVFAYSWFGQGSKGKTGKFARIDQELQKSCHDHTRYSNRPPLGKEWDMPFQMMYEARFGEMPDMGNEKLMRFKRNFAKARSRDRVPSWWLYGEAAMKAALVKYGSIYASIQVREDFKKRKCDDGCWPPGTVYGEEAQFQAATCGDGSGHAIHIIAYGTDIIETGTKVPYWLIENSWGTEVHGSVWGTDPTGAKGFGKDPFTELHPMQIEEKCLLAGWVGSEGGGSGRSGVEVTGGSADGMVFSIVVNGVEPDNSTDMSWSIGVGSSRMISSVLPFKPGSNEYTFRIYAKNHPKQQGAPLESYSVTALKIRCRGKGFYYSFSQQDREAKLSWGRKTRKELKAEADALIPVSNDPEYLYGGCKEPCRTGRYSWAKPCLGLLTEWGSCYTDEWAKTSKYIQSKLRADCAPCTQNAVKLKQKAFATRSLNSSTFLKWFTLVEQSWDAPDEPRWLRSNAKTCVIATGGFSSNAQLSATYTFSMPDRKFCDERHSAPYAVGKFVHAPKKMEDGEKAEQRCPAPMEGKVTLECRSGTLYAIQNTCGNRPNSPGMDGKLGYFKMVRGVNYHGIESGAAFAIAEMNRFASNCPTLSWSRWSECNTTTPCEKGMQSRTREPIGISKDDPKCVEMMFYEERPCVGPGFCPQLLTRFIAGGSPSIENFLQAYKTQSTTIKSDQYATAGAHMLRNTPQSAEDCGGVKYWCQITTGREHCGLYFEGHFQVHKTTEYMLNYETEGGGGILEFNNLGEGNEMTKQFQVRGGSDSATYEWQDLGFHHRRRRSESKPWVQTASLPLTKGTYFVRMTRTGWLSCPTFHLNLEQLTSIYRPPVLYGASGVTDYEGAKQKTRKWDNTWGAVSSYELRMRIRYSGRYGYAKKEETGAANELLVRDTAGGLVIGKKTIDKVNFTGDELYTLLGINKFDLPETVEKYKKFEMVIRTTVVLPEAGEYVFKYQTDGAFDNQPWLAENRRRAQKFYLRAGGKGQPYATVDSRQSSASKTISWKCEEPGPVQFEVSQNLDLVAPDGKMAMPNSLLMEMKKKDYLHGSSLKIGSVTKYMSDLIAIRGDSQARIDWPERDDPLSSELKTQTFQALDPHELLIGNSDVFGFSALAETKIDAGACVALEAWAKGDVGDFLGLGLNMCDTDGNNQYLELVTYHPPLPAQVKLTNYSINRVGWVHVGFTQPLHMKIMRDPTALGTFHIAYRPDDRNEFATPFSAIESGWTGKVDVGVSMSSPEAYRYAEFYNISIEECPSSCEGENSEQVYCGEVITACGNKLNCPAKCSKGTCKEQTCMACEEVEFTAEQGTWECGFVDQLCTNRKGQKLQIRTDILELGAANSKAAPSMHHFCQGHKWSCVAKSKWAFLAEGKQCGTITEAEDPSTCGGEVELFECAMPNDKCEDGHKCKCTPETFSEDFNCGSMSDGCGKQFFFGSSADGQCPNVGDVCNNNVCCTPKTKADFPATYECGTVMDGCGRGIDFEKAAPAPFFINTPKTTSNWFRGQMGFEFVLTGDATLSKLGRGLMTGKEALQESAKVSLYRVSTKELLASIDVGPEAEVSDGYGWTSLESNVKLTAGSYRLVQNTWSRMKDKWCGRRYWFSQIKKKYNSALAAYKGGITSEVDIGYPESATNRRRIGSGMDIVNMAFVENDGCGSGPYTCFDHTCEQDESA